MAIMGNVTIKADPQELMNKAVSVEEQVSKLRTSFDEIQEIVNKTNHYWIGEAGDLHRKLYTDEQDNINQMFDRLKENSTDLEQIAENYGAVKPTVVSLIQELPSAL